MKDKLRREMLAKRRELDAEYVESCSGKVFDNLLKISEFVLAKSVFCYVDFKNEIKTNKIREFCITKTLYEPKIDGDIMQAVQNLGGQKLNCYGIKEAENFIPYFGDVDVTIIPLIACDRFGNRVGFGKGYYDKYLQNKKTIKIGLCYSFQVVESVPRGEFDCPLDYIITEKEVIKVGYVMPFLQYKCINCNFEFERLVKNSQEEVFCAKCANKVERIYSGTMFSATGKTIKKCTGNCKTCSGCK